MALFRAIHKPPAELVVLTFTLFSEEVAEFAMNFLRPILGRFKREKSEVLGMNSNWFKLIMKGNGVQYGRNLLLKGIPVIYKTNGASLKIGNDVTIRSSFLSNLVGLYCRTIIVARMPGTVIEIGDHVGISGTAIYARKGVYIGENTCIGVNCKILDNDFHPLDYHVRNEQLRQVSGSGNEFIPSKEIRIGKNCFIGCNSIILKGTVLGDGCVVGAGAVVSGVFPENCVVAGNPAGVIRRLTDSE